VPEDANDGRWPLTDGELVMNEPSWTHGGSQLAIAAALREWTLGAPERGRARPPIDIQMDDRSVYAPDVVWYREGRVPLRDDHAPYPIPDIAVEIRSSSTWRFDIGAKRATYEHHGIPELWLVDTAADIVAVFRRSDPKVPRFDVSLELTVGETLTSPLLPGFKLAIAEIFAD
jgi:Uma2 family endonuclease